MFQDCQGRMSRRQFVTSAATAAAATAAFPAFVRGAAADKPLRIGLIGSGGRGTGAVSDAITADPSVKLVAMADLYPDRIEGSLERLKDKVEVAPQNRFLGLDGYKKVLEQKLDYVILATPPYYRPEHLAACVEAGVHVFMEKPVAVDPVGARAIMEAGRKAGAKGLSVVAGTQRRHQKQYIETIRRIHEGAIGKVLSACCYWNTRQLWYRERQPGWSEDEWMHRDWVNWCWLSGDHIAEQHVHNIDVVNWVLGTHPEKVVAMGARMRRVTGDQFDFFGSDFTYPDGIHVISQCRQINGCANNVSEYVRGEKGHANPGGFISTVGKIEVESPNPYVQEHKDLIDAIRSEKPINEAQNVAESTLCAIMARTSAYTGKEVTWDEMLASDMVIGRPDYELTPDNIRAHIPVPGEA